ncbi:HIT domain-containing protein [Ningiella sp. W23]|uniref:HIT domain-containing protein n=1 Tax=Ningiella sp. W23 TaxID=3023715 RepID=UPI003756FA2F
MSFELHPQLEKDSIHVGNFDLSELRIINDANYPWFLLIPKVADVQELHHLNDAQYAQLSQESRRLSQAMQRCFSPDKMNIASLGNMVEQLHVHHIARFKTDISWPNPVWGYAPAKSLSPAVIAQHSADICRHLNDAETFIK